MFANGVYRVLNIELNRTGTADKAGDATGRLFNLGNPTIDWVAIAKGMGLPAVHCETAEEFEKAFAGAMGQRGPMFIEAAI